MPIWEEFQVSLLAYAITAGVASVVFVPVYLLVRPRRLLPMQRVRPVHWRGSAVWIAFFLFFLVPDITRGALEELGFYEALLDGPASSMRKSIWAAPLFSVLWLAILYWVMFAEFGVRPTEFGMTRSRALDYAVLGYAGFVVLTPLVLSLNFAAQWTLRQVFGETPEAHPIETLGKESLGLLEWGLVFFLATVSAPVMEEVLCRGVLQGWLRRASLAGHAGVAILVLLMGLTGLSNGQGSGAEPSDKDPNLGPFVFAAAMCLVYGYLVHRKNRRVCEAVIPIFGSAMVWSAMHSLIWPSPIPLLPLGIALGYLAYRTQSLVPGLVLHGLFNTVACVGMVLTRP